MRGLRHRIASLEALGAGTGWGPVLDGLATADLERLQTILDPLNGGEVTEGWVASLSDADAGFLASIIALREGVPCQG